MSEPRTKRDSRIPVTILTGFLGSGKTTLLNHILKEQHGHKIAVIENEFGAEGVDNEILVQDADEQIVEMNNGCICCTVRGDLVRILGELAARRVKKGLRFERVIIETTGMADPAPVAQTFFVEDAVREHYRLDAIVTLVDAKHAPQQLDQFETAQEQVGFADRILLTKSDLTSLDETQALRARLARMNPRSPIHVVPFGRIDLDAVLDVNGFNLDEILAIEPDFLNDVSHEHDDAVKSFVFRAHAPFSLPALETVIGELLRSHGPDLLRYKGILHIEGETQRIVLQGVHMLMDAVPGRAWRRDETRMSTLVFIGRNLPQELFEKLLTSCLVETEQASAQLNEARS